MLIARPEGRKSKGEKGAKNREKKGNEKEYSGIPREPEKRVIRTRAKT